MVAQPVRDTKRAAIYIRVSDPKQEENYSLDTQEAACREFAAEQGFTVVSVYREIHTAVELWERPELTRVREAMKAGQFDVLVCFDPDRFSRNQMHPPLLLYFCDQAGVELKFARFDFQNDPTGQFMLQVRVFAAQLEHAKIIERTQRGLMARAQSGKLRPGARPLYGYRWSDASKGAYEIDPDAAPVVRRMFALAAEGQSLRRIASALTDEGHPDRDRQDIALDAPDRALAPGSPGLLGRRCRQRDEEHEAQGQADLPHRPAP